MDGWDEVLAFLAQEDKNGRPLVPVFQLVRMRFTAPDAMAAVRALIGEGLVSRALDGHIRITNNGRDYVRVGATAK